MGASRQPFASRGQGRREEPDVPQRPEGPLTPAWPEVARRGSCDGNEASLRSRGRGFPVSWMEVGSVPYCPFSHPAGDIHPSDLGAALATEPACGALVALLVDGMARSVDGGLDERPAKVARAALGQASPVVGLAGLVHLRASAGVADELGRALETGDVADLFAELVDEPHGRLDVTSPGASPFTFLASATSTDQPQSSKVSWTNRAPFIDSMTANTSSVPQSLSTWRTSDWSPSRSGGAVVTFSVAPSSDITWTSRRCRDRSVQRRSFTSSTTISAWCAYLQSAIDPLPTRWTAADTGPSRGKDWGTPQIDRRTKAA